MRGQPGFFDFDDRLKPELNAALEACGVDRYLDQQAIDTTTPAGKLMFQVTGAFAEFERSMIRQRVRAGHRGAGCDAR